MVKTYSHVMPALQNEAARMMDEILAASPRPSGGADSL
jgi:hypothetical protein